MTAPRSRRERRAAGVALYELQSGGYYQSAAALAVAGSALVRWLTRGVFGV